MLHVVNVLYYVNVLNSLLDLQKQASDVVQIPCIICIQWAELHNHMKYVILNCSESRVGK